MVLYSVSIDTVHHQINLTVKRIVVFRIFNIFTYHEKCKHYHGGSVHSK